MRKGLVAVFILVAFSSVRSAPTIDYGTEDELDLAYPKRAYHMEPYFQNKEVRYRMRSESCDLHNL